MEFFLEVKEGSHAGLVEFDIPQNSAHDDSSNFFDLNIKKATEGSTIIETVGGASFTLGAISFSR